MDAGARLRVNKKTLDQLEQGRLPFDIIPYLYSQNSNPEFLTQALEDMKNVPPEVYLADFQACDAFDRSKEIKGLNLATCIICGENDRMTPLKDSNVLHEALPQSKLEIISTAGHMSMQENPDEVNKALAEFLKGSFKQVIERLVICGLLTFRAKYSKIKLVSNADVAQR